MLGLAGSRIGFRSLQRRGEFGLLGFKFGHRLFKPADLGPESLELALVDSGSLGRRGRFFRFGSLDRTRIGEARGQRRPLIRGL